MPFKRYNLRRTLAGLGLLAPLLIAPAYAEVASRWNDHPNAKVRLIAGEGRTLGIELKLAPGWKTYWRMPGDAGVPPSFDWAGSTNVKVTDVAYPVPRTMPDQGGIAVGYLGTVVFPVRLTLEDDAKPAKIAVEFAFGVCKDVCIPIESKLTIDLPGGPPWPSSSALKSNLSRVPRPAANVAAAAPLLTAIDQVTVADRKILRIATKDALDVYVEAPDSLFVPLSRNKGGGLFEVDLSASPDVKDLIGKPLKITATTANGGVELTHVLN